MSLTTIVPVGAKARSATLHASTEPNTFQLAVGSWDNDGGNSVSMFKLKFDTSAMDEAISLEGSEFLVKRTMVVTNLPDINQLKYLDYERLIYAGGDGTVGIINGGLKDAALHQHSKPCLSLDIHGREFWAASFLDGSIVYGNANNNRQVKGPNNLKPTDVKFSTPNELIIGTTGSQILILDTRTDSFVESFPVTQPALPDNIVRVRAIDTNPSSNNNWIFCSGDDAGVLRLWDRRNLSTSLASKEVGSPISSVKIHRGESNAILCGNINGTISKYAFSDNQLVETWNMPVVSSPVNSIDMLGSLAVAALDNCSAITWRA